MLINSRNYHKQIIERADLYRLYGEAESIHTHVAGVHLTFWLQLMRYTAGQGNQYRAEIFGHIKRGSIIVSALLRGHHGARLAAIVELNHQIRHGGLCASCGAYTYRMHGIQRHRFTRRRKHALCHVCGIMRTFDDAGNVRLRDARLITLAELIEQIRGGNSNAKSNASK